MLRTALVAVLVLASCKREPAPATPAPAPQGSVTPAAPALPPDRPPVARPEDWGEPDMPKVRKLFEARFAEVKRCYEAALAQEPTVRGKFTLRFTIVESGAIREVAVAGSTFRRREVPDCVAAVVRRWRTPFRPDEPVAVEYPFRFSPR